MGKTATFGASSNKLGNGGVAAAAADIQAGRAAATEGRAVAAEQEGGPSKADEQGSDDDFQEAPRGATKGAPASDARAPSSNKGKARQRTHGR